MDRRADPRVEIRLPCHLVLPGSAVRLRVGLTENMSRSGMLVAWNPEGDSPHIPKPGDLVKLDIELPANHAFGRRYLHCQAVVTRVSPNGSDGQEVALQVAQMQFRSYSNGRLGARLAADQVPCRLV